uniref:Uncharacterized protein n=1 Tax=Rhizophora mucronata TaxID=61149 RepID=A0A2P2R0Q3_RHIMU
MHPLLSQCLVNQP